MSPNRWTCPTCNREFAKKNQAHSCRPVSIDAHFEGKPAELKTLFGDLCARLRKFGPLRRDAVRSSINLASTHHFGAVKMQKDGLRVGFILARPISHPRIHGPEPITPNTYAHHVQIQEHRRP
jgi:hypothetical protein